MNDRFHSLRIQQYKPLATVMAIDFFSAIWGRPTATFPYLDQEMVSQSLLVTVCLTSTHILCALGPAYAKVMTCTVKYPKWEDQMDNTTKKYVQGTNAILAQCLLIDSFMRVTEQTMMHFSCLTRVRYPNVSCEKKV